MKYDVPVTKGTYTLLVLSWPHGWESSPLSLLHPSSCTSLTPLRPLLTLRTHSTHRPKVVKGAECESLKPFWPIHTLFAP